MYSTCLFCHHGLGTNEASESFPVGRRLAFDGAKGRLWVVCTHCGRWNLSPLEERWEAIEDCERLFRDTRLRVSTTHIGLARARDGTELVRVGLPQRPELAAWRYGAQFQRRRRRYLTYAGAGVALNLPFVIPAAWPVLAAIPGLTFVISAAIWLQIHRERRCVVARVVTESGATRFVRGQHLQVARLAAGKDRKDAWSLEIAWREAEEIASIADSLVLPPRVEEFLAKARKQGRS